jgi:hypothetical protein
MILAFDLDNVPAKRTVRDNKVLSRSLRHRRDAFGWTKKAGQRVHWIHAYVYEWSCLGPEVWRRI